MPVFGDPNRPLLVARQRVQSRGEDVTYLREMVADWSDDWQRTIYIDTLGVKTTDFSLSEAKKKALVESGRKGTQEYFKWYDNPQSAPANRV